MSELRDGVDLWKWFRLQIRLNIFWWSTITQKQFIIIKVIYAQSLLELLNVLEELAGLLGPGDVTFYSQDDKAKVLIGLLAASKQPPLSIHMEYKVTLPDHSYVITPQNMLISSVIRDIRIPEKDFSGDNVTYSIPMYGAIWSVKYSGSSAYHHLQNMKRLKHLDIIDESFNNDTGELKQSW